MRFNNIQVVRIVAAVAVVLAHLTYYSEKLFHTVAFPFAFLEGSWTCFPVPLFFAISGFVLTHAVQRSQTSTFLLGRALRLYPGFWLATILFASAIALTGWPDDVPLRSRLTWIDWTLRPGESGSRLYILGIEWSLVFEVSLSLSLAAMSLLGTRRGLPIATILWLIVLGVKIAVWPGYAMETLPTWQTFVFSPFNVPFLLGILTYYLRDLGRTWRWAVFAGLVVYLAIVPARFKTLEGLWVAYGAAAAVATWFVVQIRQLSTANPLVRVGEYSYGLYLAHVPLIMGTFAILLAHGWLLDSEAAVLLVGAIALVVGLAFGRLEVALHMRLRPLAKLQPGSLNLLVSLRLIRKRFHF